MVCLDLNIANKEYEENKNGIMICGYEWGFSKKDQQAIKDGAHTFDKKSFFSDERVNNTPYRNRIVSWLDLLGLSLDSQEAGKLEKSIIQTSWMDSEDHQVRGNIYQRLKDQNENFLEHLNYFQPKIVLFFGIKQLEVLNNEILKDVEKIAGEEIKRVSYLKKDIKNCTPYKIGFQSFKNMDIIAFPHPATRGGICDEYISMFKDQTKPIFDRFVKEL